MVGSDNESIKSEHSMKVDSSHQMKESPERQETCTPPAKPPRIYDTAEGTQSPSPEVYSSLIHYVCINALIFQNIYDNPIEIDAHRNLKDADLKESPTQNKNNDMLKELGLEPIDDNYESPVWSDSDADSWGDEKNVQNEIEPRKSLTRIKTTDHDTDKNPLDSANINESLASPSLSKSNMQKGSADNMVLNQRPILGFKDLFTGFRNIS